MIESPTLHDLRLRVFKHSGTGNPEIGNVLARRVGRPCAVYGTWIAVRLGLSAHAVTTLSLIAGLAGASMIGMGSRAPFVVGVVGLMTSYGLDHVDGQVARWRGTSSIAGVYFDYLLHHVTNLAVGFALGFGLTMRGGSPLWSLCGFGVAAGWTLVSLHNDCRYKAFFQRLKRDEVEYRVDAGSGGRPSPPPSWPMQWPGIVSWPLSKICESHVVLMWLMTLMAGALILPRFWVVAWKVSVLMMASSSLILAVVRSARSIKKGEADAEFARWFVEESRGESPSPRRAPVARRGGVASCPRSVD